jgi:[glutamine synthetase] adenylyltransferase / [glutamine synthetase]-adenylyl-L-tyrosine phosphorylase
VDKDILTNRITRLPRACDGQAATQARGSVPDAAGAVGDLVAGAAGSSPYLSSLIGREAAWLAAALSRPPEAVMADTLTALDAAPPDMLAPALRQAKRQVALITALADLGGVWSLEEVTGALTALADRAVTIALRALVGDEIARGKLPGASPDDASTAAGMVVLAMGKMGARELNYSSDIDLICLFDDARYPGEEAEARAAFIRVTRRMTALLSDITGDGYVFRTDLRLRPDAGATPVCLSMSAAEAYYEAEGRTWERAAYIKARPCGGDLAAGARFLASLTPFVWRKHLDFAAIQDAHDMRLRIRDHRGLHGRIRVEGHDLKLGQGGIREIEFFTQTRQLIAGGRDPSLRDPTTVGGLSALAAAGWVPQVVAEELTEHYRAHRLVEHRLQMVGDAQTHQMPATEDGIARIAALCDADPATFRAELLQRLTRVEALTGDFFNPAAPSAQSPALSEDATRIVDGWDRYPALRSDRARALFQRLKPGLLARLDRAADPGGALIALDGFLQGLPAGVQIFALFDANPSLVDLIVDIAATSPALARYLSRNAGVLDAVIGGSFFAPWPGAAALHDALATSLAQKPDYEARLDAARRWLKEAHFRVGVHHLRGLIDASEAGRQYADLAGAVVAALWPVVVDEFARKHGPPPGRGAAVLGMGSLGAGRLNAGSDLDLIVIYDAQGAEMSAGPRQLATRPYFARLTQALVTALTAPMAEGRLYEVDMRLRPSGRQGPVATSLQSFVDYQTHEAWTWEHLALTRACVLAGDAGLATDIEATRRDLLTAKSTGDTIAQDVADMRARLAQAKPPTGSLDVKNGPGRLMDIELFAETLALWSASPERGVAGQIAAGPGRDLSQSAAQTLRDAYSLCWTVQCGARLLTPDVLDIATLGGGGLAFLLRETGQASADALAQAVRAATAAADAVITASLTARGASPAPKGQTDATG